MVLSLSYNKIAGKFHIDVVPFQLKLKKYLSILITFWNGQSYIFF